MTREQAKREIDSLDYYLQNHTDDYSEESHMAMMMAISALSEIKRNWIPISERLPEDEQEILFSTKTGRVHSGKYHDDDSANQWYSHKDKCRAWNNVVTAWMPLPDPYKAEKPETCKGCLEPCIMYEPDMRACKKKVTERGEE